MSEIFWEIDISGVIVRVHFLSRKFSKSKKFSLQFFFSIGNVLKRTQKKLRRCSFFGEGGGGLLIVLYQISDRKNLKIRCHVNFLKKQYLKSWNFESGFRKIQPPPKVNTSSLWYNTGSTENFTLVKVVQIRKIYKKCVLFIFREIYI